MREKGRVDHAGCQNIGITPAYAGKSLSTFGGSAVSGDHPRVCGEKFIVDVLPKIDTGSPPRMRGKGSFVLLLGELIRITPACAGKR